MRIRAPWAVTALLVLFVAAATGCGSGDSDDGTADMAVAVNPCELVTPAELEAELGRAVGEPQSGEVAAASGVVIPTAVVGERVCQFVTTDTSRPPTWVRVGVTEALPQAVFKKYRDQHPGATPVADVGDEAVWNDSSNTLVVLRDETVLTVLLVGGGITEHQARAARLAAAALERV